MPVKRGDEGNEGRVNVHSRCRWHYNRVPTTTYEAAAMMLPQPNADWSDRLKGLLPYSIMAR